MSEGGVRVYGRDGQPLALAHLGGSGDVLFILHANGFAGKVYQPMVRHLEGVFDCYGLDARGQGDSPPAPKTGPWFPTEEYAWDLLAAVEALSVRGKCYAFGHSLGGNAVLRAEGIKPGTFKAIFCYEGVFSPPSAFSASDEDSDAPSPFAELTRKRRRRFDSRAAVDAAFRSRLPFKTWHTESFDAYLKHCFRDADGGGVQLACDPDTEADSYIAIVRKPFALETWEVLALVACPVVVAIGDQKSVFMHAQKYGPQVAKRVRNGHVELYHGLGHLGPLEDPAFVASRVLAMKRDVADPPVWDGLPRLSSLKFGELLSDAIWHCLEKQGVKAPLKRIWRGKLNALEDLLSEG